MKQKLLWPGILILMIGALVCVDVAMLIVASTADVYQVDPAYEDGANADAHEVRE